jgi:hypothetical protein
MRTVVISDIYGLGGFALSPGMLTLAEKIKWLGANFVVLGPYNQKEWEKAAVDLAKRPESDLIGVIGYSLGANNAVQLATRLPRKLDYLAGIQASYWGAGVSWSGTIMCRQTWGMRSESTIRPSFPLLGSATLDTLRRFPTQERCA